MRAAARSGRARVGSLVEWVLVPLCRLCVLFFMDSDMNPENEALKNTQKRPERRSQQLYGRAITVHPRSVLVANLPVSSYSYTVPSRRAPARPAACLRRSVPALPRTPSTCIRTDDAAPALLPEVLRHSMLSEAHTVPRQPGPNEPDDRFRICAPVAQPSWYRGA